MHDSFLCFLISITVFFVASGYYFIFLVELHFWKHEIIKWNRMVANIDDYISEELSSDIVCGLVDTVF